MEKQLIIGLGSGRCGTVSLYRLLNFQKNSFFTHESKPLLTWIFDKKNIDTKLKKFFNKRAKYIGDVNSCYLPYVEYIVKKFPLTKFVVLKRPKEKVVRSFLNRTSIFNWNHWVEHGGKKWRRAGKWDKMFPKYNLDSKEEAISRYWNNYYKEIAKLIKKYSKNIKIFQINNLNSKEGVKEILDFCGFSKKDQIIKINIKENRGGNLLNFVVKLAKYFLFWRADRL